MDISSASELEQFLQLQNSGVLTDLELLRKENRELERTIEDISHLISFTDTDSMLDFIITRFLDYFMPQSIVFIVKPPRKPLPRQYVYQQLQRTNYRVDEQSLETLLNFFEDGDLLDIAGNQFAFSEIFDKLPPNTFSPEFLALKPSIVIPLAGIGGVYGAVLMSEKVVGGDYTEIELRYIHRMFSILAVTLQNGLHYESSITDPKTGLYTYDYFTHRLESAIAATRRHKRNSAMIMIDIDHFKWFNDSHGHLAGDKVLLELAKTLKKTVRDEDCVARFGGEEFSVLISEYTGGSIFDIAERIRREVANMVVMECGERLQVTISLGIYCIRDIPGLTPRYIIDRADKALYRSKENGRNRTTLFAPGLYDRAMLSLPPEQGSGPLVTAV